MAQKLVQGGIKAVKNGETELARKAFTQALKLDPNNEAAWLGMATITEAPKDKARILRKVLEINPSNERAQEALRRLEPPQEAAAPPAPAPTPIPASSTSPFGVMDDAPSFDDEPLAEAEPIEEAELPAISPFSEELQISDEPEPVVEEPIILRTAAEAFAEAPTPPATGSGGIPIVNAGKVRSLSEESLQDVQSYLETSLGDYLQPEVPWTKKRRGRAGESEYGVFLGQVALGVMVFLVVAGFGAYIYIINTPAAQKLLFAPTHTPTNTPTVTPSLTPGVTNTPSPTPQRQATATPTIPITITPGNPDQFQPPTVTPQLYDLPVTTGLRNGVDLMLAGDMDAAFELLQTEVDAVVESGDFIPTYRLSQWYILNDQPDEARQLLLDWEEKFQGNASLYDRSLSLLLIAYARVDVYQARNGIGDRASHLSNAEERLDRVLGISNPSTTLDALNSEAYVLLAQTYELMGDIDEALDVIERGLETNFQGRSLVADTSLLYERAQILANAQRYSEALQAVRTLLTIAPFNEEGLLLQIDIALESGQAGLGVLAAQQYLLYYPGSTRGFYLLGQAREAENKNDLALNAYSRAVAGDPEDENYTSDPFYLEALLRRAELYTLAGRLDLAADDYRLALNVSDDDEIIRVRSLESNYASGNYQVVLEDAAELLNNNDAPRSQVLFYQGRAYIALGSEENQENYELGLDALNQALGLGLNASDTAEAQEYIARANLALGETDDALTAVNAAIAFADTTSLRFLRGQIYEAQATRLGRNADFQSALLDYEYVLTWGQIYAYPYLADAQASYDAIIERLGER